MTAVKSKLVLFLGLLALMVLTRTHHFGDLVTLPDATLGVFFLTGLLSGNPLLPLALLGAAGLSDLHVMGLGESGWCVTPAYAALIPAYLSLWGAARWVARSGSPFQAPVRTALALLGGVAVFFLVSNIAFYLHSGYFADLSLVEYMIRIGDYFLPYLAVAALYVGSLLTAGAVASHRGEQAPSHA